MWYWHWPRTRCTLPIWRTCVPEQGLKRHLNGWLVEKGVEDRSLHEQGRFDSSIAFYSKQKRRALSNACESGRASLHRIDFSSSMKRPMGTFISECLRLFQNHHLFWNRHSCGVGTYVLTMSSCWVDLSVQIPLHVPNVRSLSLAIARGSLTHAPSFDSGRPAVLAQERGVVILRQDQTLRLVRRTVFVSTNVVFIIIVWLIARSASHPSLLLSIL